MTAATAVPGAAFRHEAFLYGSDDEYVAGLVPFLREALQRDEPVLVAVGEVKASVLRAALDGDAERVAFTDMAELGHNPARIIPAWQVFRAANGGRPLRGVGEPIWPGRGEAQLVECHRHEALLNRAFAGGPPWWLLCPYDTAALAPAVVAQARRNHPFLFHDGAHHASTDYVDTAATPFTDALSDSPAGAAELAFDAASLPDVRRLVARLASTFRADQEAVAQFVVAVGEVAANSVRHGGGTGTLRVWADTDSLIAEIRDAGTISDPMTGRVRPQVDADGGRGLWLANQLCDLVQVRSGPAGSTIRLHLLTVSG